MMAIAHIRDLLSDAGTAVILGYGGSGRAARAALSARNFECRVADRTRPVSMPEGVAAWGADDDVSLLAGATLLVKSPGVDRTHPMVTAASAAGVPVVAEVELGWALTTARIVGITGSNGKSTTTAWLAHVLTHAHVPAQATGNIGVPMTEIAPTVDASGALAVELSSFQLEDLDAFDCDGAIVLNITPDHLDRHGGFEVYRALKLSLLDRVRPGGFRIVNADDEALADARREWMARDPDSTLALSLERSPGRGATVEGLALVLRDPDPVEIGRADELPMAGPHNVFNALAVGAAASRLGVGAEAIAAGLRTFSPLRHRLEPVATIDGIHFVNDSKATNLDSLRQALRAYPAGDIVLIAGGRDKDSPFEELADEIRRRARHVVVIGEATDRILSAWPAVSASTATTLDAAVDDAFRRAGRTGVVLLSPGCASYDMFTGFADRGEQFAAIVNRLARERAAQRDR